MNSSANTVMPERAVRELAAALASLVIDHDVLGTVTNLLAGCERSLGAAGSGIVVSRPDDQRLDFLAATSHRAEDIELYQAQTDEGPAADTISTGKPVTAVGDTFTERWPDLARLFHARGFHSVYAYPMRWRGQTFGALNLFFSDGAVPAGAEPIAQAFSDIATVVIIHSGAISTSQVIAQLRTALADRVVIEQAKGVLAYTDDLTVDAAFDRLLALARHNRRPLSEIAADVVNVVASPTAP
jgi:hypothetical protein